jgi:hypothetical protein
MAEAMIVERWHTLLSVLPTLSGDSVNNFVKQQCVAKETSLRGYKFFVQILETHLSFSSIYFVNLLGQKD